MGLVSLGLACRAPLIAPWRRCLLLLLHRHPRLLPLPYLSRSRRLTPSTSTPASGRRTALFFSPNSLSSFITCSAGGEQVSVTGWREAAGSWAAQKKRLDSPQSYSQWNFILHSGSSGLLKACQARARRTGGRKGGERGGGGGGLHLRVATLTHRVMDYCTTGNNVLSHLGKLLSRLGDFEIH